MTAETFRFSWTVKFDEQQFIDLFRSMARQPRFAKRTLVGLALLFSQYTMLIGILILILTAFGAFMTRFFPGVAANIYREVPCTGHKTTYFVDEQGLEVKSRGRKIVVRWRGIGGWQQKNGWLSVGLPGFSECLFRVSDLKQAGIYDQVLVKCQTYGRKK